MKRLTMNMVALILLAAPAAAQSPATARGVTDLVAALASASSHAVELERMIELPADRLVTVDVTEWSDPGDRAEVARLAAERADGIDRVQAAVDLSPLDVVGAGGVDGARTLERVLADRGVAIRDILAVEVRGPDVFVYHTGGPAVP